MNRHLILAAVLAAACASTRQPGFETADEAVRQLVQALRTDDLARAEEILGEGGADILYSGDEVADANGRKEFVRLYDEKNRLEPRSDGTMTLCVGEIDWPLPGPVVRSGDVWVFDAAAGREEILDRRIGKNELNAIQVCLAYCDAQSEYAMEDRDGDGVREYAQGPTANGGAHAYVVRGDMIGGFALVAYPAEYGNSGVMTFVVNYDGKVFEKDLGDETEKVAEAMKSFDPDATWKAAPE
jgi:hypothetical protein